MNDLTLVGILLVITIIAVFYLCKRFFYLNSSEAKGKFSSSEIKNTKVFLLIGIVCNLIGAFVFSYKILTTL